jgi:hypothetical protein
VKTKTRKGRALGDENDEGAYAAKAEKAICANVRMLSGCKDEQTSADVNNVSDLGWSGNLGAGGACTNALLKSVSECPTTWIGLLQRMQKNLKSKRFPQIPQLSASRKLDLNAPFDVMTPASTSHKALLIGINYKGQKAELSGCHNDVAAMKAYIMSEGFTDTIETMKTLCDDGIHDDPTAKNICDAFKWLVEDVKEGCSLFLHYSGHGGSIADDNGDEKDGKDETIVPLDYLTVGHIRDDDMYKMLVAHLPVGVDFTIVMDCCHSGSVIDLPYVLSVSNELVEQIENGEATATMTPNVNFSIRKIFSAFRDLFSTSQKNGASYESFGKHVKRIFGF